MGDRRRHEAPDCAASRLASISPAEAGETRRLFEVDRAWRGAAPDDFVDLTRGLERLMGDRRRHEAPIVRPRDSRASAPAQAREARRLFGVHRAGRRAASDDLGDLAGGLERLMGDRRGRGPRLCGVATCEHQLRRRRARRVPCSGSAPVGAAPDDLGDLTRGLERLMGDRRGHEAPDCAASRLASISSAGGGRGVSPARG